MRTLTIANHAHLGDCLLTLHYMRGLLKLNPELHMRFGHQPAYHQELEHHVSDLRGRLQLVNLDECASEALDGWIGPWKSKFDGVDLTRLEHFYLAFFRHMTKRLEVTPADVTPRFEIGSDNIYYNVGSKYSMLHCPMRDVECLHYDNPLMAEVRLYDTDFDVLLINGHGLSGQLAEYRQQDFQELADTYKSMGCKVITTEKLEGHACTRYWNYNLLQIGKLAQHVRYVSGVNTAPLIPAINTAARERVLHWMIFDQNCGWTWPRFQMLRSPGAGINWLKRNGLPGRAIPMTSFQGQAYPQYITKGHHARFILPLAQEVCKGHGLDVGCSRPEWAFPGARLVDPSLDPTYHADRLPGRCEGWDFIFSSHCLEHVPNYVKSLEHWKDSLRPGGVVFLYLPHPECAYWRPWNQPTRRHVHSLSPDLVRECLTSLGFVNVHVGGPDLAYSFAAFAEKPL